MTINTQRFIFGWSIILFWVFVATQVFAADLAVPHRQALTITPSLPPPRTPVVVPARSYSPILAPMSRAIEPCLANGVEPTPGQALQADITCPTGLRWKYQK